MVGGSFTLHTQLAFGYGGDRYELYGIWQPVKIVSGPPISIADVFGMPSVRSNLLTVRLTLRNDTASAQTVNLTNTVLDGSVTALSMPAQQVVVVEYHHATGSHSSVEQSAFMVASRSVSLLSRDDRGKWGQTLNEVWIGWVKGPRDSKPLANHQNHSGQP
ncbi:MAG: hypothetical protein P4L87_15645 [Formivibrio sp.]|nr:hypothetical protein [Formivibrio sp.]